jgi:hypothetical protein
MKAFILFTIIVSCLIVQNVTAQIKSTAVFGNINAGYSNYGACGHADISYRKENKFFSLGYYKSHICYLDIDKGKFSDDHKACENHQTIYIFSGRIGLITQHRVFLSTGLAYSIFFHEYAKPMSEIVSFKTVLQTALNENFGQENINTVTINKIGIPVEARINFSPSRFAGFNAGIMVYLNTEKTVVSADIGIRIGKVYGHKN